MMTELIYSLLIVVLVSSSLFAGTVRISRRLQESSLRLMAALTVLAGTAWFVSLRDQVVLSRLIPHPSLIVLGNWFPYLAAILAALAWNSPTCRSRRRLLAGGLSLSCCVSLSWPLLGQTPECGNRWDQDICLQTTPYSCSAASAATLLKAYGIEATEAEMAELCLTRRGTHWMGLYRGLSLKTEGTRWTVEVKRATAEDLQSDAGPVILAARLPEGTDVDPVLQESCGWIPGQGHSVVFMGFLGKKALLIGDPGVGRELWRTSDLDLLWTGLMLRLVPREPVGVVPVNVAAR